MRNILSAERLLIDMSAFWVETAVNAVVQRGRFDVALSGGRTPEQLYRLVSRSPRMKEYWPKVHLWFGDERCVPSDSKLSNFMMVKLALGDHAEGVNIHRMEGELDPNDATDRYGRLLGGLKQGHSTPVLDLVMLGVGTDGHIASLFPGSDNLLELTKPVSAAYIESVGMWRISITLPVILSARRIMVIVTGEEKTGIVEQIFTGRADALPVGKIAHLPQTIWFMDEAAAARLPAD